VSEQPQSPHGDQPTAQPQQPESQPQEQSGPQAPEQPQSEQPQESEQSDLDASLADVQAKFDEANDKGHFHERVDPTPLENYSVAGVLAGAPTPETDAGAAAAAAQATGTPPNVTV